MKIEQVLRQKGRGVVTVGRSRTVLEAARLLVQHNIGAVVVTDEERLAGILSERDILRLTARTPGALDRIRVESAMTHEVVTATPDDDLGAMMDLMTRHKVRHLPVVQETELVGIVSIGDLVNASRELAEEENHQLRQYVHGGG